MKNRKRVLFCGEASVLSSGYAVYAKELLTRLHKRDDLEIAELGCYISPDDPRISSIPWRFYANKPSKNNQEALNQYDSYKGNEYGEFSFNEVCLHFKPDYVLDIRDHWMLSYQANSPFRDFYNWIIMPTVDAAPQNVEWLDDFMRADAILTYSEFGRDTLTKQCPKINFKGVASPAASDNFYPIENKDEHRASFNIDPNVYIVGTVMRNQRRKLFPDLFESFRGFLNINEREDVFLYCHTGFPDISWNIPELLIKYDLSNKVLFTYKCASCGQIESSFFHDAIKQCSHCKKLASRLASTNDPIEEEQLNQVYNLFDIYVQYANCLVPGQGIKTLNGWVNIEDVKIGDYVLTHNGNYKRVLNNFCRHAEEEILSIKCKGDIESLDVTSGHPLLTINPSKSLSNRSKRESIGNCIRNNNELIIDWTDSDKIKKGDVLCYAIDKTVVDKNEIDLTEFLNDDYITTESDFTHKCSNVKHDTKIEVSNEFCEWIGLYVSDGTVPSYNKNTVMITLHEDDYRSRNICDNFMFNIGNVKYKKENRAKAYYLRVGNAPFARYLSENCGKLENKKLPEFCEKLPIDKQKHILYGLFCGDGHSCKSKGVSVYTTISKKLAEQISLLLQRVGIVYNLRKVNRKGNRKPQYRFEVPNFIKDKTFSTKRNSSQSFYYKDYYCRIVKSVDKYNYNGNVYTLEVEDDNSYVSRLCVEKNCEGFGMPMIEAAKCGLPVCAIDYSAMSSNIQNINGYPIPPLSFYVEAETGCKRAVPDNKMFASMLRSLTSLPKSRLKEIGLEIKQKCVDHYSWDKAADQWYLAITQTEKRKRDWSEPALIFDPEPPIEIDNPLEQANFLISYVLKKPELIGGSMWRRLVRDLTYKTSSSNMNNGFYFNEDHVETNKKDKFYFEDAYEQVAAIRHFYNQWEMNRVNI